MGEKSFLKETWKEKNKCQREGSDAEINKDLFQTKRSV